jgi:flagellar basal body-associated protein FliL
MPDIKDEPEADKPADTKTKKKRAAGGFLTKVKKLTRKTTIVLGTTLVVLIVAMVVVHHASAKSRVHVKAPIVHGPVLTLDEFLVNLADPSGDHYLKVTVGLELDPASGKTADSLKDQVPIIRDAVLTSLTSKTRDQVDTLQGREDLRNEIKTGVNQAIGQNIITHVYFTDFVTQ